jgi:hypothetical protein
LIAIRRQQTVSFVVGCSWRLVKIPLRENGHFIGLGDLNWWSDSVLRACLNCMIAFKFDEILGLLDWIASQ